MSDRFFATLQIGGKVNIRTAVALMKQIEKEFSIKFSSARMMLEELNSLRNHYGKGDASKWLIFDDPEAGYGQFPMLEVWLKNHAVPFNRFSEAHYEYDGEAVFFRPKDATYVFGARQSGSPWIERTHLMGVLKLLDKKKYLQAKRRLEMIVWPKLPELPAFEIGG